MKKVYFLLIVFLFFSCKNKEEKLHQYFWKTQNLESSSNKEVFLQVKVAETSPGTYQLQWKPEDLEFFSQIRSKNYILHLPQVAEAKLNLNSEPNSISKPPSRFTYFSGWLNESELSVSFFVENTLFLVPISAVYSPFGKKDFIWILKRKRAKKIPIRILARQGKNAIVIGEFEPEDKVILNRLWALADDMLVVESI